MGSKQKNVGPLKKISLICTVFDHAPSRASSIDRITNFMHTRVTIAVSFDIKAATYKKIFKLPTLQRVMIYQFFLLTFLNIKLQLFKNSECNMITIKSRIKRKLAKALKQMIFVIAALACCPFSSKFSVGGQITDYKFINFFK